MRFLKFLPLVIAIPQAVFAAPVTGKLIDGGGTDDMQITVQTTTGQKIHAYCADKCGDWFEEEVGTPVYKMKRSVKGKTVLFSYAVEQNGNRIVGPDGNDRLTFVKRVMFIPRSHP